MPFIDNLAYSLFSLGFAGLLLLYIVTSMYLAYRKGQKDYSQHLESAGIPLLLVGAYIVIAGFWGQITWPLPGSYNILFYDPFVTFGLLILAFALCIRYGVRLEYAGFFGMLAGIMTLIYGAEGYSIGLTSAPLALLALFACFGIAGVLSYPVALIADRLPGFKKNPWPGWTAILAIFWIFLLAASLIAGYIGASAISTHLITAP